MSETHSSRHSIRVPSKTSLIHLFKKRLQKTFSFPESLWALKSTFLSWQTRGMFLEEVFVSIIGLFVCANKIVSQRFPGKVVGKQKHYPSPFISFPYYTLSLTLLSRCPPIFKILCLSLSIFHVSLYLFIDCLYLYLFFFGCSDFFFYL